MSDERRESLVLDRLAELRRAMSEIEAPARVKPEVMAAFRAARRRPAPWTKWAAAAAACLALTGLMLYQAFTPRTESLEVRVPAPPAPAIAQTARAVVVPPAVRPTPRSALRAGTPRRKPGRVSRPAAAVPEVASDFLALPFAPPFDPGDGGQVVRVRLPRSAMRAVGLPVREDAWYERVPADVVLGQDGVARAVRFVKFAQ